MSQHQALILPAAHGNWEVGPVPTPTPGPDDVLVKVLATALNPVDWKIQKYGIFIPSYPAVVGSDAAGEIAEVGSNVTAFKKGDKVFHQGWFTENPKSTFQQYDVCPANIVAKIPGSITVDEAATIPLGVATAAVGLYQKDGHPVPGLLPDGKSGFSLTPPWEAGGKGKYKGHAIVIFGGSSSVGQYTIQLAKLSGFNPIITTCSPKHEPHVKSLGATHVVNRSGDTVAEIKKLLPGGKADYVYDSIAVGDTQKQAVEVLSDTGSVLFTLPLEAGIEVGKKNVISTFGNVHFQRELGIGLYAALPGLIESGDIKPNKVQVVPGGLKGIIDGLEDMAADKVSGVKLIAHPWE